MNLTERRYHDDSAMEYSLGHALLKSDVLSLVELLFPRRKLQAPKFALLRLYHVFLTLSFDKYINLNFLSLVSPSFNLNALFPNVSIHCTHCAVAVESAAMYSCLL